MTQSPRPRRPHSPTAALFVRIPTEQADRLDRAAFFSGRAKQDLIAALLEHYVDPDTPDGLSRPLVAGAVRQPAPRDPAPSELSLGHYAFHANRAAEGAPEVLTLEQAADLLQVEPAVIAAMAERGELPARRMGDDWRLSRRALIDWLAVAHDASPPPAPRRASGAPPGERQADHPDR